MSHLADVNQNGKPKLSRTAQNLLRASLGNARIAVRQAITASNMAAAVFLDAEAVAGLARDQGAERALDERGYGLIKVGLYDMRLTPVGSPPPPCPDDEEFKPALGCWLWNPSFGELRFETNGAIVRQAMMAVWDACKGAPEAATGLQPVICCADSAPRTIKSVNKTFRGPVIKTIGWVERDKVPGWAEREPTVLPPKALAALHAAAAPAIDTQVKKPAKVSSKTKAKPAASDPNDDIPY
jgi:hypothetical protein